MPTPSTLLLLAALALLAACADDATTTTTAADTGADTVNDDAGCTGAGCNSEDADATGEDTAADVGPEDTAPDVAVERCGDGERQGDEVCDDGELNGTAGHCDEACGAVLPPGCGDGVLMAPDEACDDGPLNGEPGKCAVDCSGPAPFCGDGVIQHGSEACDHGAQNGSYGQCAEDCSGLGPRCGDGVRQESEELCDDGELNGAPGQCRADCSGQTLGWTSLPDRDAAAALDGLTCEPHDWLAKYMRYRRRLRGDGTAMFPGFVSIGTEDGESMPAARREKHVTCQGHWEFEACPRTAVPDAHGLYKWGDGTIWLGAYLEVLATEYAMFADLGLDTTETVQELHLAMGALDRLDEGAERFYGVAAARDGYFLRDDVPVDFMTDGGTRWRFPREDGYLGYECVASDISCRPPETANGSFTSQDQVIGLLHGLALVTHLVPESVVVDGQSLVEGAREKVHRMVWHLRDHGWKVTAPDGEHPPDAWGGNAIGFSNEMAKIANAICGDAFGVDDYRNLASRVEGGAAWTGLQVIWGSTHNFNRTMALRLNAANGDWDADKTASRAVGDDKDYFAMTWALLQQGSLDGTSFSAWRIESILDSATCAGPCRGYDDCEDAPGWKGENRIMNPGDRSGSRHFPRAEFNGLDYMALHNAYYLYRRGHYGFAAPTPAGSCVGFGSVDQLRNTGSVGDQYASFDPCVATDFERRYCGRSFASWLDDAYAGKVTIFTRGLRWQCDDGQPCTLVASDAHTDGDDLILGSDGNDELYGDLGNDCIIGFGGDDKLEGGQGYDELHGDAGQDRLYGESSGLVLDGERDTLFGGDGDDYLKGGPDADALYGGEGNDELLGDGGDDILEGGAGDDVMRGNEDSDTMSGGPGNDNLIGDSGDDVLWGGPGRDKLDGEGGEDACDGEEGDDFVRGGLGDDVLIGGDGGGHDRLCGNGGDDVLWGGWDGDECRGGGFLGGTDQVNGCDDDTASDSDCDNGGFDSW